MVNIKIPDNPQYQALTLTLKTLKRKRGPTIEALHRAQEIFGYIPEEAMYLISKELGVPVSTIYGIVTFYHFFRTESIAKYLVNICQGTACHVKGADKILRIVSDELGIKVGETTPDNLFTLSTARCFGCCGLAPVMIVNEDIYGNLTEEKAVEVLREYKKKEENN